jgi:hypothetical protein
MARNLWTTAELEIVLTHTLLSNEALAALLPGRTAGAVEATREAVHAHHTGASPKFNLRPDLRQWLAARPGVFRCPRLRCNAPL